MLEKHTGVRLPDHEAVGVALHLINAESETGDIHATMMALKITADVDDIIERELHVTLDKDGFQYSRFAMHLRYLIQRLSADKQREVRVGEGMLREVEKEYSEAFVCANRMKDHLMERYQWCCNSEELMYLALHIHRLQNKN